MIGIDACMMHLAWVFQNTEVSTEQTCLLSDCTKQRKLLAEMEAMQVQAEAELQGLEDNLPGSLPPASSQASASRAPPGLPLFPILLLAH